MTEDVTNFYNIKAAMQQLIDKARYDVCGIKLGMINDKYPITAI